MVIGFKHKKMVKMFSFVIKSNSSQDTHHMQYITFLNKGAFFLLHHFIFYGALHHKQFYYNNNKMFFFLHHFLFYGALHHIQFIIIIIILIFL